MHLGAFSNSLNVKDLNASANFYQTLGFTIFGGSVAHKYLIMKNGNALIGLFQDMIPQNMMTFNPGWDENAQNLPDYTDVRKIQAHLVANGITPITTANESTTGPAHIVVADPDGNMILIDQHV